MTSAEHPPEHPVPAPDQTSLDAARSACRLLTAHGQSWGELTELLSWAAGAQHTWPVVAFQKPSVAVVGTVSQWHQDFAHASGLRIASEKNTRATEPSSHAAYEHGTHAADTLVDEGADLIIPMIGAVAGPGQDKAAAAGAVVAALLRLEPQQVLGFDLIAGRIDGASQGDGATISNEYRPANDTAWMTRCAQVRDRAWQLQKSTPQSIPGAVAAVNSPSVAWAAGLLEQSARRHTPALIDGPTLAAAALLVGEFLPAAVGWWYAAHSSKTEIERYALGALHLAPLHSSGMQLGEGVGTAMALPTIQAALAAAAL